MNVFLRACPFCGSIPIVWQTHAAPMKVALRCIRTGTDDPCPVGPSITDESVEAVSSRWNTRIGVAA